VAAKRLCNRKGDGLYGGVEARKFTVPLNGDSVGSFTQFSPVAF
jgi:hypothetical protein